MRDIPFHPQKSVISAFKTPIGQFRVPGADQLNPGIEKEILRRMEFETGKTRSNVGGWHSNDDLFHWEPPEFGELRSWIRSAVTKMVALGSGAQRFNCQLRLAGWANVNGPGQFNATHNHPGCSWSGVYYVRSGDFPDDPLPRAGQIQFYDPRGGVNMIQHPGKSFFASTINFNPKDGRLLIFPSWLFHSVNPFMKDARRVSIAFNARIRGFKSLDDEAQANRADGQPEQKAVSTARAERGADGKTTAARKITARKKTARKRPE